MTNSALNRTTVVQLTNKSGALRPQGSIVIVDTGFSKSFDVTTTPNYTTTSIGVVLDHGGIDNNATGSVALSGWVPKILLTTSAALGDTVSTSSTVGQGTPSSELAAGNFAQVLETGTSPEAFLYGATIQSIASGSTDVLALERDNLTFDNSAATHDLFTYEVPGGTLTTDNILQFEVRGEYWNYTGFDHDIGFYVQYGDGDNFTITVPNVAADEDFYFVLRGSVTQEGATSTNNMVRYDFIAQRYDNNDSTEAVIQMGMGSSSYDNTSAVNFVFGAFWDAADPDLGFSRHSAYLRNTSL